MSKNIIDQIRYEYERMLASQNLEDLPDWQAIQAASDMMDVISGKGKSDVD